MKREMRRIVYDKKLRLEAYRFEGILQPFPSHFHEHYVSGFVEQGERILFCKNCEYNISKGTIVLFNPGESHGCVSKEGNTFDYCGFHINKEVMLDLAEEIAGKRELPEFATNVIRDKEVLFYLRFLHSAVINKSRDFEKEEALIVLFSLLFERYGNAVRNGGIPTCSAEIENACRFLQEHYAEPICLEQLCRQVNLSKSTLIRGFTRETGVTPYRYLENIRVGEARKLLEQGMTPVETAMQTGFSDQSHFTNYFSRFIGLPPGLYRNILCSREKQDDNEKREGEKEQL